MLDTVTEAVVPIGAEHFGRARDLRRKVAAEDKLYDATVAGLIAPVCARLRKHPRRAVRQQMLVDLVQGWRFMEPRDWRLDLSARLDRGRASLTEIRLAAGVMRPKNQPDWTGDEDDVGVLKIELAIDRSDARINSRCIVLFSLHAVARRLQRAADGSTEALLADMALAAEAASGELVAGAGYRVTTDAEGGGWRGRAVQLTQPGTRCVALNIRTWLSH